MEFTWSSICFWGRDCVFLYLDRGHLFVFYFLASSRRLMRILQPLLSVYVVYLFCLYLCLVS